MAASGTGSSGRWTIKHPKDEEENEGGFLLLTLPEWAAESSGAKEESSKVKEERR